MLAEHPTVQRFPETVASHPDAAPPSTLDAGWQAGRRVSQLGRWVLAAAIIGSPPGFVTWA